MRPAGKCSARGRETYFGPRRKVCIGHPCTISLRVYCHRKDAYGIELVLCFPKKNPIPKKGKEGGGSLI